MGQEEVLNYFKERPNKKIPFNKVLGDLIKEGDNLATKERLLRLHLLKLILSRQLESEIQGFYRYYWFKE